MGKKRELVWEILCTGCRHKVHASEREDADYLAEDHKRSRPKCAGEKAGFRQVEALTGKAVR